MEIKTALSFDDVLIEPRQCVVNSREDVSLDTEFLGFKFKVPIISANMSTVTEFDMALAMHKIGGLGIIHRMMPIEQQCEIIEDLRFAERNMIIAASIDIGPAGIERAHKLISTSCNIICIDVAHAHSFQMRTFLNTFLDHFPEVPFIIGNIATPQACEDLIKQIYRHRKNHSNYAFKIGVGSGSQCTTRIVTGCGIPTLQSVLDIKAQCLKESWALSPYNKLIADGGIKNSGDIVKSLAAGASMVMIGNLLAGTDEAPGKVIKYKGQKYKVYRGSASFGQKLEVGKGKFVEGEETLVPYKGPVKDVLEQLIEGIKSGCSYCGVSSVKDLPANAHFVRITNSGFVESTAHGA